MRTVLVVDHPHAGTATLMERLRATGCTVMNVSGVDEVVELNHRTKIDLIILELLLMRVGGLEVLRRLRDCRSQVPIVVYTCLESPPMLDEARELGAIQCFVKSRTSVDELVAFVGEFQHPSPEGRIRRA